MAYFFRLVGLVLLLSASVVYAAFPPQPRYNTADTSTTSFATRHDACVAHFVIKQGSQSGSGALNFSATAEQQTGSQWFCYADIYKRSDGSVFALNAKQEEVFVAASACPANSTGTTSCTCTAPSVENSAHTACVPPPDPCLSLAGKSAGSKNWEGQAASFTFCDSYQTTGLGSCLVTASKDIGWESPPGSGHWISQGSGTYTGGSSTSCNGTGGSGSDPAPSTPPGADGKPPQLPAPGEAAPSPCPAGQQPGEVNGARVCAPVGPDITATDKKEVKNPDGTTTTTTDDTRCRDGKCTTDSTACTTAAGTGGATTCQTTTTTQGQGSLCATNKGSKACTGDGDGSGGSFTGDCAAGFKADGDDPVLNAMALEQYKRNCEVLKKDSPESQAYDALKDVAGTSKATNPNDSTVSVGPSNFDTSDALGGGSCGLNKTIQIRGISATLPFNVLCDPLAIFGNLLVGVSLLLAARIVARG